MKSWRCQLWIWRSQMPFYWRRTIRFEHVFFINKQFRTCANTFPNEFTVRSYEYCACQHWNFTGYKIIKQRRISFVLGYLRIILWKISTAISIKHRILATFNKKKSILTACMPLIELLWRSELLVEERPE